MTTSSLPEFPNVPQIRGRILVGGEIRTSGFETREVKSTCGDHRVLGLTPHLSSEQFIETVNAAVKAWDKGRGDWAIARMEDRIAAVSTFRNKMLEQCEIVCRLLMWEIGKSWTDAQGEFDRTIEYMDATLAEVRNLDRASSKFLFAGGIMAQVRRAPLGVTLCMGPFNYPLNETFTTLIPALIMGNVVVAKIPRFGRLLWDPLLEAFRDSFPAGVVNIINGLGREIVAPAVRTGRIDTLAFIGSSPVANQIKLSHPHPHRFRSILGLDAKNPAIVLKDADLDTSVAECLKGSLSFNGQRCTAIKVIFVHKSIAAEFTRKFSEKVDALVVGQPWDARVQITPLPDNRKPEYLKAIIEEAVAKGAKLANPGRGGKTEGSLFYPAVISQVPLNSRLANEEQFGPVVPICEFDTVEEIENYIVNSPYGSQASLFGTDPVMMGSLVDRLANQVCRINLNAQCQRSPDVFPFTGRKDSAEGTLSVYDALRSFSIRTMVAVKQDEAGKVMVQGILRGDTSRFISNNILF